MEYLINIIIIIVIVFLIGSVITMIMYLGFIYEELGRIEDKCPKIHILKEKPVVRGEWIEVKGTLSWFCKCSECGTPHEYKRNFCPNCGADMRTGVGVND